MKKVIISLFLLAIAPAFGAQVSNTFQCGPGYVLESHKDIDGIDAKECQKLWCRDLETGKVMGKGKNPASGYKSTSAPMESGAVASQQEFGTQNKESIPVMAVRINHIKRAVALHGVWKNQNVTKV